jgi:hypothetical protein
VYTAYAFYRQLPLGVPGAYRLFANLLSLGENTLFKTGSDANAQAKHPLPKTGM